MAEMAYSIDHLPTIHNRVRPRSRNMTGENLYLETQPLYHSRRMPF